VDGAVVCASLLRYGSCSHDFLNPPTPQRAIAKFWHVLSLKYITPVKVRACSFTEFKAYIMRLHADPYLAKPGAFQAPTALVYLTRVRNAEQVTAMMDATLDEYIATARTATDMGTNFDVVFGAYLPNSPLRQEVYDKYAGRTLNEELDIGCDSLPLTAKMKCEEMRKEIQKMVDTRVRAAAVVKKHKEHKEGIEKAAAKENETAAERNNEVFCMEVGSTWQGGRRVSGEVPQMRHGGRRVSGEEASDKEADVAFPLPADYAKETDYVTACCTVAYKKWGVVLNELNPSGHRLMTPGEIKTFPANAFDFPLGEDASLGCFVSTITNAHARERE
jgi:hypothetical protein